tara:strand:- start:56 stop:7936 length:7881 start_codon:yes stop_codon:yes gene_type:complete
VAFGAPALSRQAMQQALRNAGALSNTGTPKSSIDEIGRAIGVPASSRYTPPTASLGPMAARNLQKWSEEKAAEDMPLWAKAITTGPVGGFLNIIQKPLALTTSAMKEGIDLFTGQEASWGDFTKQVGDNYTFGRLLGDYDLLQGEGWQKWAARGVGFAGDVIFDPLNLLKPVNAGAKLALQVAKRGTRPIAGELARNAVLQSVRRGMGDDVARGVSKVADDLAERGITWETLADDIAEIGTDGVSAINKGKTIAKWSRNVDDDGWTLINRTAIEGGDEVAIDVADDVVNEITDIIKIGADVQAFRGGPTVLSANNLRTVAKGMAKTGMDSSYRMGADPFTQMLGDAARLPSGVSRILAKTDEATGELVETLVEDGAVTAFRGADGQIVGSADEAANAWRGRFLGAAEAENIKYQWGMSMPFTGVVGRALRVADPIERLSEKFIRSGAQYPVGLRLITSETPYVGRMVTGIPQGLRKGVAAVGGNRLGQALLTSAGRMGQLKTDIRESTDAVFRQRGKRVVHAVARGDSVGKTVRTKLMRVAAPFLREVKDLGADTSDVYYAISGDVQAAENIARLEREAGLDPGGLVARGKQLFADMRTLANKDSGRDWIGEVDDYVPRQLTDKIRDALFNADQALSKSKYVKRVHQKRGKYSPTIDQSRKYIDTDEFGDRVKKLVKEKGISENAAKAQLRSEGVTDQFYGETLVKGSVEKQIAEILERTGADYSLFADDIDLAIQGWIRQVSARSGEVYTESLLMREGILIERLAEYSYLPSTEAVAMAKRFHAAQARMANAAADLTAALERQAANLPDYDSVALQREVDELQEVYDQAFKEVERANKAQEAVFEKFAAAEEAYTNQLRQIEETNLGIKQIEAQQALFDDAAEGSLPSQAVKLEERRLALVAKRDSLYAKNIDVAQTAYDRVASGTAARLYIENALAGVLGSAENFRAFLRDLGNVNPSNLQETLETAPLWTAPDGNSFDVERVFAQLEDVLGSTDKDSIGVWLGVESQLADPAAMAGDAANPAVKLDFALQRIDIDSQEASRYLDQFDAVAPDNPIGGKPDPEDVIEAKRRIIELTDDQVKNNLPLSQVVSNNKAEMRGLLRTYFAGANFPVATEIAKGSDLGDLVKQVDQTLGKEIQSIERQLDDLAKLGEDTDLPIRINIVWQGQPHTITVKDYVFLRDLKNGIDPLWHGGQIPAATTRVSVDDILEQGTLTALPPGQAPGSNPGGLYELNGNRYYIKRYGGVDDPVGLVDPVERASGEVIANALYRELGLTAPDSYVSRATEGGIYHVAPFMDNIDTVKNITAGISDARVWTDQFGRTRVTSALEVPVGAASSTIAEQLFRGYAADVLLANWDVVGMGADNIGIRTGVTPHSAFVRIDNGAVFNSRAQGLPKTETPAWDPTLVSEQRSFQDPAMSPDYAPLLAEAMQQLENPTGLYAQQIQSLLDLRAQYGGMNRFVHRFVPGLSDDEAKYFSDWLEVRLQRMAQGAGKEYFDEGSEDLLKQAYSVRGWSEDRIDAAVAAGSDSQLLLNHRSSNQLLNLIQRPNRGYADFSWGDYDFLNTTVAPQTYQGSTPTHRFLLDIPQGAANIKVYGLRIGESEAASAQKIIDMQNASDPMKATADFKADDWLSSSGGASYPVTVIQADMFARVADADPDFFDEIVNRFIKQSEALPAVTDPTTHNALASSRMLKWAKDIVKMDLSNIYGADRQILEKLMGMSFAERVQFAAWRKWGRGVDASGNIVKLDPQKFGGDIPSDDLLIDNLTEFVRLTDNQLSPNSGRVNGSVLSAQKEMYVSLRKVWDEVFDSQFGDKVAFWNLEPTQATKMPRWTRFLRTFQRSLSADGYSAMVWYDALDGAYVKSQSFPNMMLANPSAAHGADVAMTSQNIGKLLDPGSLTKEELERLSKQAPETLSPKEASAVKAAKQQKALVLEPEAVIDFFEREALSSLSPLKEQFPKQEDLLEALYEQRSKLIMDSALLQEELSSTFATWQDTLLDTERMSQLEALQAASGAGYGAGARFRRSPAQVEALEQAGIDKDKLNAAIGLKESLENAEENVALAQNILENIESNGFSTELQQDLAQTLKVLMEADNARLSFAWDEYAAGANDFQNILDERAASAAPWSYRDIAKMDDLTQEVSKVLDETFEASWKPIGNQLQGPANIVEAMTATETWVARGGFKGFMRQYDRMHNLLRAYMIAKPGFHGRNFFSASFMNHLAGMNASSYRKFMRAYWKFQEEEAVRLGLPDRASKMRKAMRARGIRPENVDSSHVQIVREMDRTGSLGSAGAQVASEFVESEVRVGGRRISLGSINPLSAQNLPLQLSRDFGMATETFVRGSLGFDTMLKGGTAEDAFDNIMKFHFDYSDLSDFERNVVKKLVPFYTWTRKNLPLMMEMMLRKPQIFNRYNSFKKEMEEGLERPEEVPDWMVRGGAIQTPFTYDGESMFILPDLPFKSPLEMIDPLFTGELTAGERAAKAISTFGSQMTPLVKAPYEWQTKRNLWKGYNFDGRYDEVPRAYTMVPGMMPALKLAGIAQKRERDDKWVMKDYELHSFAQLLPTFMDIRRLFPDEERYRERLLSNWISFMAGAGLRTNTKWEQQRSRISREFDKREQERELRELQGPNL